MANDQASGGESTDHAAVPAELVDRIDALEAAMDDLEGEFDEKIEDVRARVIQVKREADAKTPAEDHEALLDDVAALEDQLADGADRLENELDHLAAEVTDLEDRLEAGFANYEEVLEYLVDANESTDRKLSVLAQAIVRLRDGATRTATREAERAAVDRLKAAAQDIGASAADCEACGGSVQIGLLTSPRCPHCEAGLSDIESRGFLRADRLLTGEQPALEEADAEPDIDLEELVRSEDQSPPTVEAAASAEADTTPPAEAATDGAETPPLDGIEGIGAAYAERLRMAGIDSVAELAEADPTDLTDRTGIAPGRIETWIERARERSREG